MEDETAVNVEPRFTQYDTSGVNIEPEDNSDSKETSLTPSEDGKEQKKSKGTKRKASIDIQLYTCEVCQVKLNSASQAYQHFQGKSHQGKVKMLEMAAEIKAPSLVSNSLPVTTSTTATSPSTGTVAPSSIEHYCTLCQKIFNSKNQADQHFSGKAHRHKLSENAIATVYPTIQGGKSIARPPLGNKNLQKPSSTASHIQPLDIKLGGNVRSQLFTCEHCHITLNSQRQYDQHVNGLRHKIIVGKAKPPPPPQGEDPGWQEIRYKKLATAITTVGLLSSTNASTSINPGGTRLGQYYCKDCDVSVNSPVQLQQHMNSTKHKAKINGIATGNPVPNAKRKPAANYRGRGGVSGVKPAGRGAGRGRVIPALSSNFVKGGEITPYQSTNQRTSTQPPSVNQSQTTPVSVNSTGSILSANQNNAAYPTQYSLFNQSYLQQPSYPAHIAPAVSSYQTQLYQYT